MTAAMQISAYITVCKFNSQHCGISDIVDLLRHLCVKYLLVSACMSFEYHSTKGERDKRWDTLIENESYCSDSVMNILRDMGKEPLRSKCSRYICSSL